ncbi:hypothetical protein [Parabacteroides bouchesdurhonensis]|uniref:hypothetical protein n=1 Tax=Parabacteroides bouchesdurhonensis TaxID=1936995 RepID=UPI000E4C5651|nr:hypothetical protein [Parabacteroides bouchesdurhonensis]RHJ95372.1 hypothetical protein DW095_02850 [Bacteroides sp. AM07-16]
MKLKLPFALLLLCASFLFTGCGNGQSKSGAVQSVHADDVPMVIMDNLTSSAYKDYKIESIQKTEKEGKTIYTFTLKQDNNKVTLSFDAKGQAVE